MNGSFKPLVISVTDKSLTKTTVSKFLPNSLHQGVDLLSLFFKPFHIGPGIPAQQHDYYMCPTPQRSTVPEPHEKKKNLKFLTQETKNLPIGV